MRDGVFVHEQGLCESDDVGSGTRVWAFAHVLPGARVGRDCNICDGAYVESGAVLGDRVTVKNQALVFDRVEVGDDCFLGPGVDTSLGAACLLVTGIGLVGVGPFAS